MNAVVTFWADAFSTMEIKKQLPEQLDGGWK
ncbi:hypothetical protein PBAL39_07685 [Pedobacter sp. BAL39]|nr:hypothetical protein PBAL39_07685 [Pedobacter sp. BAL39]